MAEEDRNPLSAAKAIGDEFSAIPDYFGWLLPEDQAERARILADISTYRT